VLVRPAPAPGEDGPGFGPRVAEPPTGDGGRRAPVLDGVRVVDLGVGVAIPEAGMLLADLGAEVIKIESQANIDFLRRVTVEPDAPDRSWTFNDSSRGHESVCLDLRTPRGRALALRLCAAADVVIENNRGGVVRAWGLDYEEVRRLRSDIIYVASQGFGRGGPLGEASAYGPSTPPSRASRGSGTTPTRAIPRVVPDHPDHIAAKLSAVAVLAALEHRRRTGEGQLIEMSQAEAAAYLIGEFYLGPARSRVTRSTTRARTASTRRPARARVWIAGARSPWSATTRGSGSSARSGGRRTRVSRRSTGGSPRATSSTGASPRGTRERSVRGRRSRPAGGRRLRECRSRMPTTIAPIRTSPRAARSSRSSTPRSVASGTSGRRSASI